MGFDAFAGVIKSGGKTRRAAKMTILNIDHPDVVEFINCKAEEEKKAWTLINAGYDGSITGEAYSSVFFQNSNTSVRVTDEFMQAVVADEEWQTRSITTGQVVNTLRARDVMRMIAESAHICGDPGMQFDTTVNAWHTSSNTGRINASNPCVTGDTLVATTEGWRRIDSLVGQTARVIGLDGQPHRVTHIFPTGVKPVLRLRTRSGFQLRLTEDHKVWTLDRGDVAAKDLKAGDKLELQGPGFGRTMLSEALATAAGVAVGDGCLSRSRHGQRTQEIITLTMAASEAGVLEAIASCVNEEKRERRAVGAVGRGDDVAVSVGQTGARLAFSSQPVVDVFTEFAVLDAGSSGKRFTDAVYDLDRRSVAALLRGLFTADGTVANYGDKSQYVSLDSCAAPLLRQVQLLLLGFGIKSKLYENRRAEGTAFTVMPDGRGGAREYPVVQMHSLRISRSSRVIFEREIGFHAASPKADAMRELNEAVGVYRDEMSDEVESIELLGEEAVFDLTEDATHHFVANGLMVHNCSEYMFLDDSACNLSSLNLMKFRTETADFDVDSFRHACGILITAQEILVGNASYPTPAIAENSHDYRPLGLGYANLGALLMANGLPYDSDKGRAYAAAITAIMTGAGYKQSAEIARQIGPFPGYHRNREPMLAVMQKHADAVKAIDRAHAPCGLVDAAEETWTECLSLGARFGYRNAQATVLAPTGTIGFMMDCDTTGIEPDIALVKYKKLVGGGLLKIVNGTVPEALRKLGYSPNQITEIIDYIDSHETIEGAPGLHDDHLAVFDCAFKPIHGVRTIHYMGHVQMMAVVQPFISGAISKTVNLPTDATPKEIEEAYMAAWRLGLKAIAVYRDGSKRTQPLSTSSPTEVVQDEVRAAVAERPARRRLPDERRAITHKFSIGGHEGYITVGMYEDGTPGEVFITMSKEGSVVSGLMDGFATAVSMALQYGVPLEVLCSKFSHMRFEPSGFTNNKEVPIAKSVLDYIFRWLSLKFLADKNAAGSRVITADDGVDAPEFERRVTVATAAAPRVAVSEAGNGGGNGGAGNGERGGNGGHHAAPAQTAAAATGRHDIWAETDREPGARANETATATAPTAGWLASDILLSVDVGPSSSSRLATADRVLSFNAVLSDIEAREKQTFQRQADAPACQECGSIMVRNGACYKCPNCGSVFGCS